MSRGTVAYTAQGTEIVCTATREQYLRAQAEDLEPVRFVRHTQSAGWEFE